MSRFVYPLTRWSLLVVAVFWAHAESWADKPANVESKPVVLEVTVPETAEVFIDGAKTKSTGAVRKFISPDLPVNKKYVYTVKAVWKGPDGKEVEREVKFPVTPGMVNQLDLTKDQKEEPKTAGLKLEAPGLVNVEVGKSKTIPLTVKRENLKGPVKVTFSGVPEGASIEDVTIPANKSEGNAEVKVDKDAKPAPADLVAKADGGSAKAEAKIKLSIKAAAPPPAKLTLTVPATLEVEAGAKKSLTVKVKRENFKGPIKVTVSGLPEGIKVPEQIIEEDDDEAKVEIAPVKDAKAGTSTVKVAATGGSAKAEAEVKLTVKVSPPPPPKESLSIEKPATLEILAGGKKNLTVKIKRDNVKGPVKVTFTKVPKDVKIADLTIPEDQSEGTAEVTVEKGAKAGTAEVIIQAESGDAKTQTPAKLDIKAVPKPKDKDEKPKDKDEKPKDKDEKPKDKDEKPKDK